VVCQYAYDLATTFNRFYHECHILNEERAEIKLFRLNLVGLTADALKQALYLIGVEAPERM
jgi:arginyl-tRNA synthetase